MQGQAGRPVRDYGNFLYQNPGFEALFGAGSSSWRFTTICWSIPLVMPSISAAQRRATQGGRVYNLIVAGSWHSGAAAGRAGTGSAAGGPNAVFAAEPMAGGTGDQSCRPGAGPPHDLLGLWNQAGQLRLDPLPDRLRLRALHPAGWPSGRPRRILRAGRATAATSEGVWCASRQSPLPAGGRGKALICGAGGMRCKGARKRWRHIFGQASFRAPCATAIRPRSQSISAS